MLIKDTGSKQISIKEYTEKIDKSGWVFKVEKIILPTTTGKHKEQAIITRNSLPLYQVNDFLIYKSLKKTSTGRTYAYSIVKYLQFLAKRNLDYIEANILVSKQYIRSLIFGEMEDLKILGEEEKSSYNTIYRDIVVLREFYKYLKDEETEIEIAVTIKKRINKKNYLYGQIYEFDYLTILDKYLERLKPSKTYTRFYTEDEKNAIRSNFSTLRDEVVYLLTLEGMRIDEVLSTHLDGIDHDEKTVTPTRSKGKNDESEDIRIILLPKETYKILNNYLGTERARAESESGIFNDHVFINIKKNSRQGEPLAYHNYLKILKGAAKRAGLDEKKIKTHGGRSTKVDELLMHQVKYPEDNITDKMIQDIMGWKNANSIEPYKNRGNKEIMKTAAKKVIKRKEETNQTDVNTDIKENFDNKKI